MKNRLPERHDSENDATNHHADAHIQVVSQAQHPRVEESDSHQGDADLLYVHLSGPFKSFGKVETHCVVIMSLIILPEMSVVAFGLDVLAPSESSGFQCVAGNT